MGNIPPYLDGAGALAEMALHRIHPMKVVIRQSKESGDKFGICTFANEELATHALESQKKWSTGKFMFFKCSP